MAEPAKAIYLKSKQSNKNKTESEHQIKMTVLINLLEIERSLSRINDLFTE